MRLKGGGTCVASAVETPLNLSIAWFLYNRYGTCGTGGSVQGRVRLRYLLLVPGTAGRVQSCLRYRRYRTVREKESHESLLKWSSFCKSLLKWSNFCQNVFFLVIEDSTKEESKSKVNINFGSEKYFNNVHKIDNSTDCFLN